VVSPRLCRADGLHAYRSLDNREVLWHIRPAIPHRGFARNAGPASDRALELMKSFVARQLDGNQGRYVRAMHLRKPVPCAGRIDS